MESAGIPTTGISLVREHTASMQLPRFLWVSFPLGRPFGAPHQPVFQKRVLKAALDLFDHPGGPVLLEDFPEDAPQDNAIGADETAWSCPVSFAPQTEPDENQLVAAALREIRQLQPWHEIHQARHRFLPPLSRSSKEEIVRGLAAVASGESLSQSEEPLQEWIRLACDDLRNWYLDAARGQPGHTSIQQIQQWFWTDTAAARLIAAAAGALLSHENPMVVLLAQRAMVPREYLAQLLPAINPAELRERSKS